MEQLLAIESLMKSAPLLLQSALMTLQIAFCAVLLGTGGGFAIGILNCSKLKSKGFSFLLHGFVWTIRGTPLFVQLLIIYFAVPEVIGISFSPFTAGVIALGINSSAYVSEIVRAGIDAIAEGQWEASYVLGYTKGQTLRWIILPQVVRHVLPSLTNELTALIKETSILMVIGVVELTKMSKDIVSRDLNPMMIYLAAAVLYLAMTSGVSLLTKALEKRWAP